LINVAISAINSILAGRSTDSIMRIGRSYGTETHEQTPVYIMLGDNKTPPKSNYPDFSQFTATSLNDGSQNGQSYHLNSVFE
jgi:hypothetical protein